MEGRGDPFHSETSKKDGVTRACSNYEAGDRKPAPLWSETKGAGEKRRGRGNLRHTEHSIIVVKSFVVLYGFSSAILEGVLQRFAANQLFWL